MTWHATTNSSDLLNTYSNGFFFSVIEHSFNELFRNRSPSIIFNSFASNSNCECSEKLSNGSDELFSLLNALSSSRPTKIRSRLDSESADPRCLREQRCRAT